jgi:hypothetical protein
MISSEEKLEQLHKWAHEGSKDSLQALISFIASETDQVLLMQAELAKEECQYFYYMPRNELEEKEFQLARMIKLKEQQLIHEQDEAEGIIYNLDGLVLDREINRRLVNSENNTQRKEWVYRFSEDYYLMMQDHLVELNLDIEYDQAWMQEAKKMLTLDKYQDVPASFFYHLHNDHEALE